MSGDAGVTPKCIRHRNLAPCQPFGMTSGRGAWVRPGGVADEKFEVLTTGTLHIPVTGALTYRPVAQKIREFHTQIGPTYYDQVIRPVFMAFLRSGVAHHKHKDLARVSPTIDEKVLAQLRQTFEGKPFEIGRVSITHIEFDRGVTQTVSEKGRQTGTYGTEEVRIGDRGAGGRDRPYQGQWRDRRFAHPGRGRGSIHHPPWEGASRSAGGRRQDADAGLNPVQSLRQSLDPVLLRAVGEGWIVLVLQWRVAPESESMSRAQVEAPSDVAAITLLAGGS